MCKSCKHFHSPAAAQVELPLKRPTACTFGGPDLAQLFVTTRVETGADASEHWGSILSVRIPGVAGRGRGVPCAAARAGLTCCITQPRCVLSPDCCSVSFCQLGIAAVRSHGEA